MKIYDAHQDIAANIQLVTGKDFLKRNFINEGCVKSNYNCINQVDYPRLLTGGVKLVFATIFAQTKKQALEQFNIYEKIISRSNGKIIPILSSSDLSKLNNNKIGFLFNMEGATPIKSEKDFDIFYKLGLRSVGIVWRGKNKYISGDKLSKNGLILLKKIHKKKIILDLAHASESLFWDIASKFKGFFIVSHTACRTISNNERNMSDKQILEIKKRKGLVGIAGVNLLVGGNKIKNVINNIKHVIKTSSINNICLGSDFDGMVNPKLSLIKNFEDVACYQNLINQLNSIFETSEVKKIAYKNLHDFIKKTL